MKPSGFLSARPSKMAKDAYHETVKRALEKDGWRITDDPFMIRFEDLTVFADLGAERVIAAEKDNEKIVVEIKVFGSVSTISEFEKALGQYNLYRSLMKRLKIERQIFLAVSDKIYKEFFERISIEYIIEEQKVSIFVFNPEEEVITLWKRQTNTVK